MSHELGGEIKRRESMGREREKEEWRNGGGEERRKSKSSESRVIIRRVVESHVNKVGQKGSKLRE